MAVKLVYSIPNSVVWGHCALRGSGASCLTFLTFLYNTIFRLTMQFVIHESPI